MKMQDYEIIRINDDTWRIENNGVRFFLLTGKDSAILVDSGMTVRNAREIAEGLTSLPLSLICTHADIDHIGSNSEFAAPYMHPAELSNYHNTQKSTGEITPVWDGDIIDLGDRELCIIHLPGHTPGSIAVLDRKHRVLISGDPIQDGNIFMFGVQRDLGAYRISLERLREFEESFDVIYPSHGAFPIEKDMIEKLIEASENIIGGQTAFTTTDFLGSKIRIYDAVVAKFLCEAK